MRIIAGSAGGLALKSPPGGLRPTMDRVKAAIFSSLGDLVPDARVLDLYAGSGSMGIEALSRGAREVVFVDSDPRSTACIRQNLRTTRLDGSLQTMDAQRFLDLYAEPGSFDLVLADPPYFKLPGDTDHSAMLMASGSLAACLTDNGLLVLEKEAGRPLESPLFETIRSKRYGGSEILFLSPAR
jgi:16S rRNA (guanine966-N2)-methyltransferase